MSSMPTSENTVPTAGVEAVNNSGLSPVGNTLSSGEAQAVLNQYGVDPNAVLSAPNIAQTTTAPAPAPDDLLGIRASLMESLGVNTAQQDYLNAIKAAQDAQGTLDASNLQLRGRPVSVSKFTGQIGQNTMVNSQNIKNLQDAASIALENLNAKKSEANTQFAIREAEVQQKRSLQVQYPGAKIKLTDSFDDAVKKLGKYQKEAEKDAYKKTLRAKAMELGIKTSGSAKDLEKRISKVSKAALDDAKKKSDMELQLLSAQISKTRADIGKGGGEKDTVGTLQEVGTDPNDPLNVIYRDTQTGAITTSNELSKQAGIKAPETQPEVKTGIVQSIKNWWNSWSW